MIFFQGLVQTEGFDITSFLGSRKGPNGGAQAIIKVLRITYEHSFNKIHRLVQVPNISMFSQNSAT